jgi:molybdate transport repressor ModE-like protein
MDTLAGMQLFQRVAQAGSFSAAGRQVGLSPAAVFRAINALEDLLGARLLNRTSRKLSLTEAGQLYHARLEQILAEIHDVNTEVGQLQHAPRGILRVHARVSLGVQHLAPILPAFLAEYPELRVDLRLSDSWIDLVEENIDVTICLGGINSASLQIRKLATSPRIVCASPSYLARHPPIARPEDLTEHNCLTFRADTNDATWRFMRDNQLLELQVRGSLRSDNAEVLRLAAVGSMGVALLPQWCVGPDLKAGSLVALLEGWEATPFGFDNGIYVVTQKSRHRSMKVQLFLKFLTESFQSHPDWLVPPGRQNQEA